MSFWLSYFTKVNDVKTSYNRHRCKIKATTQKDRSSCSCHTCIQFRGEKEEWGCQFLVVSKTHFLHRTCLTCSWYHIIGSSDTLTIRSMWVDDLQHGCSAWPAHSHTCSYSVTTVGMIFSIKYIRIYLIAACNCWSYWMVCVITACGVQWTGLPHSLKINSDCLIQDKLVRYCPKTFKTAKGQKERWCHWELNPGPLLKPPAFCHSATTPTVWLSVFGLWESPIHWTPHAMIMLTIHMIANCNQSKQSNPYFINNHSRAEYYKGKKRGGCRWVLWLSGRALAA